MVYNNWHIQKSNEKSVITVPLQSCSRTCGKERRRRHFFLLPLSLSLFACFCFANSGCSLRFGKRGTWNRKQNAPAE